MEQSARVICDSVGPNGARVTSLEIDQIRFCHPELLRHRLFSFSVASSRAIPYEKQLKQVADYPMMPTRWPKHHRGMQGTEVFEGEEANAIEQKWLELNDIVVEKTSELSDMGLSKQLTNRPLETWVSTRCVITATNWDNFFELRHPHHYELDCHNCKVTLTHDKLESKCPKCGYEFQLGDKYLFWEDKVNLNFPAEYNLQDLAIKMKQAMNASEPKILEEGEWHLPFITEEDWDICHELYAGYGDKKETILDTVVSMLLKISAARCARTSYGFTMNKTIEDDIKLADILLKEFHMSPFEHQAQAVDVSSGLITESDFFYDVVKANIPKGMELRLDSEMNTSFWSGNFQNWVQNRKLLELQR